jgi:hypothetical protein
MKQKIGTRKQVALLLALNWFVFVAIFATLEPGITLTTSLLILLLFGLGIVHVSLALYTYFRKSIGLVSLLLHGVFNPVVVMLIVLAIGMSNSGVRNGLRYQSHDKNRDTTLMLEQSVALLNLHDSADLPKDSKSLVLALTDSGIDWDSCRLTAEGIEDSWGHPIQMHFDPTVMAWTFRSVGEDGIVSSEDDIVRVSRAR